MVDLLHTFLFVLMAFFFYLWPSCFAGALFFLLPILFPSLSLSCLFMSSLLPFSLVSFQSWPEEGVDANSWRLASSIRLSCG